MSEKVKLYRRNGKNVYIKQPELQELEYVEKLWTDVDTMKDIGGIYKFPKEKWEMFYKKMVHPTDGKNFYCLVYTTEGEAIGEVSFHGYDSATKIARFNLKIHYKYRNKGYGEEALNLLLEHYFLQFGGDMIMDNVHTEEGQALADKVGFKAVRNYKGERTVRISRDEFLNKSKSSRKNVAVVLYDGINFRDYSMIVSILKSANDIIGNDIFKVYGVGEKDSYLSDVGVKVNGCTYLDDERKPDIIMLLDSNDIDRQVENNKIIEYILDNYNNCDFVCGLSSSIKILNKCRALDGVPILNGVWVDSISDGREKFRVINDNFIDNGKLMLSSNMAGTIELIITLVKKLCGKDVSEILSKELGFKVV